MSPVTFASQNGLGEIVLDSPPLNLFDLKLTRGLRAAADTAASSEVRPVLLGAGSAAFSAGVWRSGPETRKAPQMRGFPESG